MELVVALNMARCELLCSYRQVRMYCFPVTMKLFIRDMWKLIEKEEHLDVRLVIRLCIVGKLLKRELMIDLSVCHFASKNFDVCKE